MNPHTIASEDPGYNMSSASLASRLQKLTKWDGPLDETGQTEDP